jgi:hypothetical protein
MQTSVLPACPSKQVGDGGVPVLGLELNAAGRRLLVSTADHQVRVYLLHRPGDRQPLREYQRLGMARKAGGPAAGGVLDVAQQQQQQQGQPAPPAAWQVHDLAEARRLASAGGQQRSRSSVLHDNASAWLTQLLSFTLDGSPHPCKCAAYSPGEGPTADLEQERTSVEHQSAPWAGPPPASLS